MVSPRSFSTGVMTLPGVSTVAPVANVSDPLTQMNTYRSYVTMLADPGAKDEIKLKAAQELSENFELIVGSQQYPAFLEHAMKIFLKILSEGEPHFISEYNIQQVRKLILEMIHRLPTSDALRPHVKNLLTLMFKLLETENEENVLVGLRIIIELHKQYRPQFSPEIQHFLHFVKAIYRDLPNHLHKIFEPRAAIRVKDLTEVDINALLSETYTITAILSEKKTADGTQISYNLIPRAVYSLKVLQELPIIVVLMYQLYKQSVHQDVEEFIPLIMSTVTLQPAPQHRDSPSFNKEVFVDFMGAQIKTLSFLAYVIRMYQETVAQHSNMMVQGVIGLLTLCPPEVAHQRKELLVAARHILSTELRTKFVPVLEQLFDENVLLGGGWTVHETLRPLAYSTLADLVHHVRHMLPLKHLASAVHLFSKNVHDESLPTNIQTMSCKLLLNLVDLIRQRSEAEHGQGRQLLMRMLEVFVLKFKTIVKLQLPVLMSKWKSQETPPKPAATAGTTAFVKDETKPLLEPPNPKEDKSKFGFPASQAVNYSVADCRSLVKTLVCGAKTITWGCASCKTGTDGATKFQPKETLVFIKLVKWALQALDIYTLSPNAQTVGMTQQARSTAMQTVRTKEEKEVLEHFAGVFTMMDPQTFQEVFSTSIDYMVNRIARNSALQIIGNTFLSNPSTSPIFATVLVEYLLERMEEMGHNVEKSNLYLRLFKLVFGCVSLFPAENEQMLRPHLHQIVNRAMELALSAREPYNYFLLLRALFRSIGGGSHDLLYQEFLPLLPNLLQGLNSLQSSLHKQHMKDLFVELCLTVPVRLSSLLPYLPMLMDPLVSALNGSHTLISQGLRTLELCVDNLQPDFLYEHIQPVRADLMQALWRTLRNPTDQVAHVAFRVLGKFGGGNRKMMIEPQRLEYNESETPGPAVITLFQDYKASIAFPVEKVIETAFVALKTSTTDAFYKRQAWEVIRCYLVASMNTDVDDKLTLSKLLSHPSFVDGKITLPPNTIVNKSPDKQGRATLQTALTGMFVACAIKDLKTDVSPNLIAVVQHFTLVAITQQAGPFPLGSVRTGKQQPQGMDPFVLIDALTVIMGHEEKELIKPGSLALHIIVETATTVLGTKERACKLPLMQYLAECMCNLCYDRAWFAKVGGCIGIKNLLERMSMKWIYEHLFLFVRALLFVMMDLTGEVSSGAVDIAKTLLEKMLVTCVSPPTTTDMDEASIKELLSAQQKSVNEVTHELVRQVTSPNTLVRQQAMHLLELLAGIQNKSVTAVMEPFKEVLADIIPPRRHLLRHQPANAQIGLMDGNTFCTTLSPRLFTIDLSIEEHKVFLNDVTQMCELDDASLLKNPCYKSMTNLVTLRKSALKALAACHYIPTYRERIFNVLYRALERPNPELQDTAFECMKQFIAGFDIDIDMVHAVMRPLLLTLGDYRNLCLNGIKRLSYLTRLFPTSFNEKLCDQLLQHLRKLLEAAITNKVANATTGIPRVGVETELDKMAAIVAMFHQIPAATTRCLEVLCRLVLQTERSLLIEASSPFREPLMKFLLRYPADTVGVFLQDNNIKEPQWTRYLEYLIKHKDGKPFRDVLQGSSVRLCAMAKGLAVNGMALTGTDRAEVVHQSIRLSFLLSRLDDQWLAGQATLAATLQELWCSTEYQEFHARVDSVDFPHWQQPRLITKVLLRYFCHHPNEVDLLFHLLRALCGRFIPDFQFLRDFLENTVAQTYSVDWKRSAFFRFVEVFPQPEITQELKARILQYILIPCFSYSFDNGQSESIIGSPPAPEQDSPDNVVSLFISRMIDPDNPFGSSDCVRILLLQFSCLLVEQASPHIHDVANKRQGNKLRRLMTFAWPCLLGKNCVDPATRYHGHLLLSHIIAKFAIHKRIVLQVFHSLLKAHAMEARSVVRQALEILTPSMPVRMEDGNTMLTHWTKKIIVEEGHSMPQLYHILQLVVRHYKVYYPVRHHLVQYMITSIQRLGFSPASSMEQRKLAVELAEVVVKWELQRIRDETAADEASTSNAQPGHKRPAPDDTLESRKRHTSGSLPIVPKLPEGSHKPIEKNHADAVLNLLLRLSCQVNDTPGQAGSAAAATATTGQASQGELLSRRCVALFKTALKPDMWPHCDLKLIWFDKLLVAANATPQPNFANICTALELLTYLLNGNVLAPEQVLTTFKPLQRGLAACMTCANFKVIRLVHGLLSRLMTMFPTEPLTSNVASQYEELNGLYATVSRVIHEGLEAFDKNPTAPTSSLFGTLMLLKAACVTNTCYIDRLISLFMRVLQRIMREHLTPAAGGGAAAAAAAAAASGAGGSGESSPVASELLIVSLDLVKGRVGVMGVDMRKSFIGTILVGLIEKTPDVKVMRAITKMMEDWMKSKNPLLVNQMPSLREKSILLVKLMQYVEKRFPDDAELNAHFLEIVNFIYRDEGLKTTELATKLEPAFMSGLRCSQPHIRTKFFEVFDGSVRRKLFDRLLYIVSSQNWEAMGAHYWIKQCIELLLVTAVTSTPIQASTSSLILPGVCSVLHTAEPADRANFVVFTAIKDEPGLDAEANQGDEELELELTSEAGESRPPRESRQITDRRTALQSVVARETKFLQSAGEVRTCHFLQAAAQLCHMDTTLAEKTWLELLPRLWHILSDRHQTGLVGEMVPFLCSGAHVVQKDCQPSALNTFVEALSHCDPPVPIKPCLMKYLGKSHNLWHRMALSLERLAFDPAGNKLTEEKPGDCYEFEPIAASPQQETLDSLSDMYWLLCEEDLWAGLWQRHALFPETNTAIAWEQQGFFEQAQTAYEAAMNRMRTEYAANTLQSLPSLQGELVLWEKHWIRCAKELNQWEQLLEYGNSKSASNPQLVLESAWRVPDWDLMKESLQLVELSCPKEMQWRLHLYRGFLAVCKTEEQHLGLVERHVEAASALCMREWRRLPRVVSHIHLPLLQAAQQIMELQEAAQIHQGLLHGRASSLHDMKAIVKTWRNRLPVMADELSHWSDVFTWRQHHYQFISSHYDQQGESGTPNHGMLGVHASAQAIIHFGKVARKHGLTNVCLDSLSRIYTIPSVPIVDCFQKIRQQVKCYVQLASRAGTVAGRQELQEGLEVIESTNLKYFSKDMTAEFYALKGMLLAKIGRSDDANKAFSAAVQLHDTLVKAWALWGDYLEAIFTQQPLSQPNGEPVADRNMALGVAAITCFMHACRHQNESKSRKYLAKVLWLFSYDDSQGVLADAIDKYSVGVPWLQWLPWIPQLLTCLVHHEGKMVLNLLSGVGRMFPQAVYFPIRTLYLTLKIEQRERYKSAEQQAAATRPQQADGLPTGSVTADQATAGSTNGARNQPETSTTLPIRATPPMWRCSRIMHMQREIHPTVLSSLEGIVDQMVWFRESWYEEVVRQLRQGLAKCYTLAFESRGDVDGATITPHTLNFVRKLSSTFGIGIENMSSTGTGSGGGGTFSSAGSESLVKRAQQTVQDPVFHRMKGQFKSDFDISAPEAMKLHNLISKLKKWIKILESKSKILPKTFLVEEKCRFLSNFSLQTAEVELPGELLLPKHSHYYVRIARFMPRVEVVHKHNTAARRMYIRGHNGKTYPYLVVNDSGLGEARREERVLQLLRLLNHFLGKQKETSRRFLHLTVPRVVAVSPQMRLVEDNPASVSLMSVFKQRLARKGLDPEGPVARYYERLRGVQAQGQQAGHAALMALLQEVQATMVPTEIIREWALHTFPAATDYWTFRKMFTLQLALAGLVEYVLHLTRLNPDMMYIHQDSGLLNVAYFKFDVDDATGNLDANRPVPFRLTPALAEFVTAMGIHGPLTASMVAAARCLAQPSFKVHTILRAILRDEMIAWHKKKYEDQQSAEGAQTLPTLEGENLINMVTRAVTTISQRLNSLAMVETGAPASTAEASPGRSSDSTSEQPLNEKVSTLVAAASNPSNLCRMDPAWHPWL